MMLRKNLNLKNLRKFKLLFHNINHECRTTLPNIVSVGSVCPLSHRCLATAALPKYNQKEFKENTDVQIQNNKTLQNVDDVFLEVDFGIKRTGRCSKTNVENILTMIEKLGSASDVHGLYLLRCCGLMYLEKPEERVQMASLIWEKLRNLSVQLDVKHFNSLLKVFVDCDHEFLPSEFLASMEGSNIEPNKATYLLLMEKYCNDGNLNGAGEILQCLKDKGLPINESVFTILIKGHMRANDISGAKDILEVMRSANLSPTADSYATLSCGFAEKANVDGLNSILSEARDNGVILSNKHYLNIISSFPKVENIEIIDEMLGKITDVHDWRQEIANAMMGLMYQGIEKDVIAFKLLCRIANPENNFANFFIKVLLKCNRPKDYIVRYCEEISDKRLENYTYLNAVRAAIDLGKFDLSLAFFEVLHKKGIPVRSNNLNFLLSSFKDKEEGIWLTLSKMYQLGVPVEFFTYLEYVFPAVSVSEPKAVISKIQETGHSCTAAIDPLFHFYCLSGAFDNALYLIEKYPVGTHPSFRLENFINVCRNKNGSKACLKVLNYLLHNIGLPGQNPEVAQAINVATLIDQDHQLFENFLRAPFEKIQLSQKSFEICSTILRRNNPESLKYLKRLGSVSRNQSVEKRISRSITEEEEELKLLKEKGLPTQRFLLDCLSAHLKQRNVSRISKLTEELDKLGVQYPPTVLAQLLSFYCLNNNMELAEKTFLVLKRDCPTFTLDSLKVIDYATLLIKYSKFEDAINFIKRECQEKRLFGHTEAAFKRGVKNLLTIAVETGNGDLVKALQDAFTSHVETLDANILYEPLVKMHLYKNDLDTAINEFEKCVKNHHVAPCLKMLLKKCIVAENSSKLEIVIQNASNLIGKQVLYDLVVSFLETGRKSEAIKILENLKDKSCPSYIEDICTQIYNQNRVFDLLELLNLLWAVNHIDREKIVCYILKLCRERNDLKTAENLYKSVLKSFKLNDEIKELFSDLLSKSEQQIPFSFSEKDISAFQQCVMEKDAHQALKSLKSMKKGVVRTISFSHMTSFLDLLLKNKILKDLSEDSNAMSFVIENAHEILKPLLENYSSSGDIASLLEISNFFPDFALKKCSFNNYLSKGYISCEKHEDLLLELEKRWDKKNKLFSIFAFEELLKKPNLKDRAINLAKKYLECNFETPLAVVWAHYLINGHYEEAEAFYKSHAVSAEKVDTLVLRTVRQQENIPLGKAYISTINKTDVQKRCKERTYGTVLDVLVLKEMHDEAASLVLEAQAKDIELGKHYQSTLITLKNALEREKKNIPFVLSTPSEGQGISE